MTGRRRRVFPIAVALVATTLAGCTAQDAPFGIGITGYDPTLPDIPRGFSWEGPGRPKGRLTRQELPAYRYEMAIAHFASDTLNEERDGLPMDPKLLPTDPIEIAEWNELQAQYLAGRGGN